MLFPLILRTSVVRQKHTEIRLSNLSLHFADIGAGAIYAESADAGDIGDLRANESTLVAW